MSDNLIPLTNLPASNRGANTNAAGNFAAPPPYKKSPKPKLTPKPKAKWSQNSASSKIFGTQLVANRANAKKSTGPRTAEGKRRMRFNSVTHGLTGGHITVLPTESLNAYQAFRRDYIQFLAPNSPVEYSMASNLADLQFRLSRATPFENNLLSVVLEEFERHSASESSVEDGFRMAEAYCHVGKNLLNLSLHETRLGRRFASLMAEYKAQQQARFSARMASFVNASYRANRAQELDLDYDPQANGFAFSKTNLDRFSSRRALLTSGNIAEQWQDYARHLHLAGAFNTGNLKPEV